MTKKHIEQQLPKQHQHDATVLSSTSQQTKTENLQNLASSAIDLASVSEIPHDSMLDIVNSMLQPESDCVDGNEFVVYPREEYQKALTETLPTNQDYQFAKTLNELAISNPTNLSNPYWQAIVHYNLDAYEIANVLGLQIEWDTEIGLENRWKVPPLWSMWRMGQSRTLLPDGREVLIGGEYEDFYDPQFFIYNDVIVKLPNGEVQIYGYPKHIFPPTDFHTATLVDNEIWIIGSLGYQDKRQYSHTQVYKLNINSFKIEQVATRNSMGWVHQHNAEYKDGQIIVSSGQVLKDENSPMQEQIDSWALNLKTLIWTNLTNYQWQGFYIQRKDLQGLSTWLYHNLLIAKEHHLASFQEELDEFYEYMDMEPDLEFFKQLFIPPIPHYMDESHQYIDCHTVYIDDIKVRYIEDCQSIQVIVEGILPDKTLDLLKDNLCHKLAKLENSPCEVTEILF